MATSTRSSRPAEVSSARGRPRRRDRMRRFVVFVDTNPGADHINTPVLLDTALEIDDEDVIGALPEFCCHVAASAG